MSVVPARDENPVQPQAPQACIAEAASLSARVLAVFVDYLLINALILLAGRFTGSAEEGVELAMLLSALYYSLGNSSVLGGATLGKRAFGLRVCSIKEAHVRLLSISESVVRYLACFGIVLLLAEVPERIFRAAAVVGSPYLLESPMWFALVYTIGNACALLLHPKRRGFHDLLSGSIVIRGDVQSVPNTAALLKPRAVSLLPKLLRAPSAPVFLGLVIGSMLWLSGLIHPPAVRQISAYRFYIEHEFPVRIISLGTRPGVLEIYLLRTHDMQLGATAEGTAAATGQEMLEQLGRFLVEKNIILQDEVAQIAFSLYSKTVSDASANPETEEFSFDIKSKTLIPSAKK